MNIYTHIYCIYIHAYVYMCRYIQYLYIYIYIYTFPFFSSHYPICSQFKSFIWHSTPSKTQSSSIHPSSVHHLFIHPSISTVPTTASLSGCHSFLVLTPSTVISVALVYLNRASGENRSSPQSGTNCFVRSMIPEPKRPTKELLLAVLYYLSPAQVTDCAAIKAHFSLFVFFLFLLFCCWITLMFFSWGWHIKRRRRCHQNM